MIIAVIISGFFLFLILPFTRIHSLETAFYCKNKEKII